MKTKKQTQSLRPALLATLVIAIAIGGITLLKPELAQGKISVKAIRPMIKSMLADTGHKKQVKKPAQLQARTTKKVRHAPSSHYNQAEVDKKMADMNAEIQQYSDAISKYYNSEDFKKTQEDMKRLGQKMQDFYNRSELKQMQEDLANAGTDFSKNYGDDKISTMLSAQMGEIGKNISIYFNSPEFKKMNEALEKKYGIPSDRYNYNDDDIKSENYKKYQAELDSKLPPEIKKQSEQLKTMGEQIGARYQTPEFKAKNKRMQELGDSLTKAYNNPEIKEQQKEMVKLLKQISAYQNNPDIKKDHALLNEAVRKLSAYVTSSVYEGYLKQLQNMNFNHNFNFNNDNEKPEKPEKPENPENNN